MATIVFQKFAKLLKKNRIFRDDESWFTITTSLKVAIIPFFTLAVLLAIVYLILNYNLFFFQMAGFDSSGELNGAYYEFFINSFLEAFLALLVCFIVLILSGIYIAQMILRPFRIIGNYCEKVMIGQKDAVYDPDFFVELKLLTQFCEYFFNLAENEMILRKDMNKMKIPLKYTGIHAPVFELGFFLQFLFISIIILLGSSLMIYSLFGDFNEQLVVLSTKVLKMNSRDISFLREQLPLFDSAIWTVMVIQSILYLFLAFNLYQKVSVPAFGLFATLRSFLKGNLENRIHLVGYYYLRPECRKINKYLDHLQDKIENNVDPNG